MSRKSSILAILVLMMLVNSLYYADVRAESEPTIDAVREIEVGEYGVVRVIDTLNIDNTNGVDSISEMVIGFPEIFDENLEKITGIDDHGNRLLIESIGNEDSLSWYKITPHQSVSPGYIYNININAIFSNIIKYESYVFVFNFPLHPTFRIEAQSSNSTIFLPLGSSPALPLNSSLNLINMSDGIALNEVLSPLNPGSINIASFNYTSQNQNILECESLEKKLIFKPNGDLFVVENYSFYNLGKTMLSFRIDTPDDAIDIMLYDFAGPLWPKAQFGVGTVQVSTRYTRLGEGEHFNFRLEYEIPQRDYFQQLDWWGRYRFSIDIHPSADWVVKDFRVILELPDGMKIEEIMPKQNMMTNSIQTRLIEYDFNTTIPFDPEINITYDCRYLVFWASIKPLTILLILEIIFGILVIAHIVRKPAEPIVKAATDIIRRFVNLQDQRNEINQELEQRDEQLLQGAISRREYQRRRRFIEKRLNELNRILNPVKKDLSKISSRYADMIHQIEKAESELEAFRVSKFQVRNQYRSGRIVKDAYDSIISDMDKRASKAQEILYSLLITLREEAR